ncbi:MAG: ATP-binding cassette domain-containing protein [Prevotella sp.]|nr:ATP-binding cassette domain-containing protein [Prevotella sp.]
MIEVKNLTKKYGSQVCLDNVSLSLEEGRIYGMVGENGAGKSTLFRCLTNLEDYDGEVVMPSGQSVGYLSDTPFYYTYVTGREYIEFCMKASNKQLDKAALEEINSHFRLPLDKYATRYSLGMKKRLAIMTLMLQEPDIVILDEPFNGLDIVGTIILKKWFKDLKDKQKTVIFSSHIISSLTDISDEIFYIHAGKLMNSFKGDVSAEEIEKIIAEEVL